MVLIVEDDGDVREVLAEVLHDEGYAVATAANGLQALDWLRSGGRAAMILLDLMMPHMDGWQFREEQLRSSELAAIPVVVFTAHGNARAAAQEMNAVAGIEKPVEIDELLALVARLAGPPTRPSGRPL